MSDVHIYLIRLAASRSTSFIPHFLILLLPFSLLAGDIGQLDLPVGMQSVNFRDCSGVTGTAEGLG